MALPVSSLSEICSAVADFVRTGLDSVTNLIDVSVGIPADAVSSNHLVNLFFYKFEPSGFVLNTRPDEPWRLRIHCLVSVFGVSENSISAGENELRLLGEVLRIFHENPVLSSCDIDGEEVRLQIIYNPISEDQINQIWSTQGDTIYHPSVAYEFALSPVMPETVWGGDPLVGSIGNEVLPNAESRYGSFSETSVSPPVLPVMIDTEAPDWVPEICFVYNDACHKSLAFDMDSPSFTGFTPAIWLAGETSSTVSLQWETWDTDGWREEGTPQDETPVGESIDPNEIPATAGGFPIGVAMPSTPPPSETSAQYLLYAVRTYSTFDGGPTIEKKSNPLLISLYRSTS